MEAFVYIRVVILILFVTPAAFTEGNPYASKVSTIKYSLNKTNEKITELQGKIDGCDKAARGGYSCSGWDVFATGTDVLQWKKEIDDHKKKVKELEMDLVKAQANKDLSAAAKLDLSGAKIDVGLLLMDVKTAEVSLKAAGVGIQSLKAKFDQTILGEYTKYAIENSLKSGPGQQMICGAVASCTDTKKSKAAMTALDKKVKSFDQFRKDQLELLKKSQMSTPTPAPVNFNGGGISI